MDRLLTPGMRYTLLGAFLFSIGSLLIKLAGERLPTMEILFVRGIAGVVFFWWMLRRSGVNVFGERKGLLVVRGLLGFVSMFAEFYAIVHLPLADAVAIIFSHPAMVAVLAWIVLGERLGKLSILAVFASLAGVLAVCRPSMLFPSAPPLDPLALAVALGGVAIISATILAVRSLAKTEHPAVVTLYPPLFITLGALFFADGWLMPTGSEWAMLLGVALCMNGGQYLMTRGYAIESAARISGVTCLEIVFAGLWGGLFLSEIPDLWTIGGGALIVAGVLLLARDRTV